MTRSLLTLALLGLMLSWFPNNPWSGADCAQGEGTCCCRPLEPTSCCAVGGEDAPTLRLVASCGCGEHSGGAWVHGPSLRFSLIGTTGLPDRQPERAARADAPLAPASLARAPEVPPPRCGSFRSSLL